MALIHDNIERQFQAARAGVPSGISEAAPAAPRTLPSLKDAMVHGARAGGTLYASAMSDKYARMKTASAGLLSGGAGADVMTSSPEIRNPLLNLVNFYLPYDRKTLNQWIRYYDRFQPTVGNCIDMHGEFPISDFHFTNLPKDKAITTVYEEMKERCNLMQFAFESSREYELLGECFTFWQWNDEEAIWDDYTIINPDLLDVRVLNWGSGKQAVYNYEPPQELKDLVKANDPQLADLAGQLDPLVYSNLVAGKRIPLDDFNVMALIRKASPYESRGTSIVLRIIKDLMYEDKLREAQYAIADQQITPVQLWKLGDPASGYMPTAEDLQDFRNLLLAGRHDFLFTIVSHGAISLDLIGYTGKLLPIIPEMDWVAKRVMIGLYTNESMISGSGPTYSNAVVAMKVLQGRYQSKRDKLVRAFKEKLFKPIALAHGFTQRSQAELDHRVRVSNTPIIPDVEWDFKLDLTNETQRIQYLLQLRDKLSIPMETICDVLALDYGKVKNALKQEEGTVFDSVYQGIRKKKAEELGSAAPSGGMGGGGLPDLGGGGGEGGGEEVSAGEATPEGEAPAEEPEAPPAVEE